MQTGGVNPGDLTRLPPRYNGTAEEIQPMPVRMPNTMTVEGYIEGLGRMAEQAIKPGRGHSIARMLLTALLIALVAGSAGLFATFSRAFGG